MKEGNNQTQNPTLPTYFQNLITGLQRTLAMHPFTQFTNHCKLPPAPSMPPEHKLDNYKTILNCSYHSVLDGGIFDPIFL